MQRELHENTIFYNDTGSEWHTPLDMMLWEADILKLNPNSRMTSHKEDSYDLHYTIREK